MSLSWVNAIRSYFDEAASNYATDMTPVFNRLAQGLIDLAAIQPGETVFDAGTGTGAAANAARKKTPFVFGLDISRHMLAEAKSAGNAALIQGDIHRLPLPTNSMDVAIAAFALNSTDPVVTLVELHRVLRPGGRILIQEWDVEDDLSEVVSDIFASYAVDDPPESLVAFREQMSMGIPWDDVETIDDLIDLLSSSNFKVQTQLHESPLIEFTSVREFLRYKLAWPARMREMEAMPPELRSLCLSDLQENMETFAESNGNLIWRPIVFRVVAEA